MKDAKRKMLGALNLLVFVMMVTVNALANIVPIAGIGTGDVSDAYPNLFAPAAIRFLYGESSTCYYYFLCFTA